DRILVSIVLNVPGATALFPSLNIKNTVVAPAFCNQLPGFALKYRQREAESHCAHDASHATRGKSSAGSEALSQKTNQKRSEWRQTAQHHGPDRHHPPA